MFVFSFAILSLSVSMLLVALEYSVHDFMAWPCQTSLRVMHDDTFSLCRNLWRQSLYLYTIGTNSGSDQSVCEDTFFLTVLRK